MVREAVPLRAELLNPAPPVNRPDAVPSPVVISRTIASCWE